MSEKTAMTTVCVESEGV